MFSNDPVHPHVHAGRRPAPEPLVAFTVVVSSGVTSSGLTFDATTYEDVLSGGLSEDSMISSGGLVTVESGGRTVGDMIVSGGAEVVSKGGVATNLTVSAGGLVSGAGVLLGGTIYGDAAGLLLSRVDDEGSYASVESGGLVSAFTLGAFASLSVLSGGQALATTASGGDLVVEATGSASGATASAGGAIDAADATVLDTRVLNGGLAYATGDSSGGFGVLSGVVVSSGGRLELGPEGEALGVHLFKGGGAQIDGQGDASQVIVAGGALSVGIGGTVSSLSLTFGGTAEVANGGTAELVQVTSGGFTVDAGGIAEGVSTAVGGSLVLNGLIGDGEFVGQTRDVLAGALTGSGIIEQNGGTLVLSGQTSGFTGLLLVYDGVTELASAEGAGAGGVLFGGQDTGSAATLMIDAADRPATGALYASTLSNFDSVYDRLDLAGLAYVTGATAVAHGDILTVKDGAYTARFTLAETRAAHYVVASDGKGGTLIRGFGSGTVGLVHAAAAFASAAGGPGHVSPAELQSARVDLAAAEAGGLHRST